MGFNYIKYITNILFYIFLIYNIGNANAHILSDESGWAHPLTGFDHFSTMVAVGAWSAIIGGRAVWMVPGFFLIFMLIGGVIGVQQIELPYSEIGISLSVFFLGLSVAIKGKVPIILASIFTAVFGVCHGFAHGYEIPVIDDAVVYFVGFMATTAILHIIGLVLAHFLLKKKKGEVVLRVLGLLCAVYGLTLISGFF